MARHVFSVSAPLRDREHFFKEVGVPVATRTTPPQKFDPTEQTKFIEKVKALAPKYRTELLREA
jgi:hypothetical protein